MFCACVCMDVSKRFCVAGRTVFFCARLRASPVRKGVIVVFPFRAVFYYLYFIFGMRVQTRNVFATCMSTFISNRKPNTVFCLFDVS